ncbi:biliverdin-producing heme oxygenase [Microlunatus parietis]|uniref:Heme oxygenase n=1 Tax=Microlunatus parietis TaxID=682979 RepID=A0A7Y9LFA3_9ACTN|nr:biliverdin-producing heme oxygenase [Microlunatus parietis]NYE74745.1 heme oxygenase [Microlunatus parietis]
MTGQTVDEPFSIVLRRATAEQHDRAESAPFVAELLGGRLGLGGLAALAGQNLFVYTALESAAERWRDDPVAGPFVIDGLERLPGLRADLERLVGPSWSATVRPLPATLAYAERIRDARSAARFVAHHYTRYLGDVSGGQVIAAAMRRQHGDRAGLAFYDFGRLYAGPLRNPAEFRRHYRALLDAAPWTAADRAAMIDESREAFGYNRMIFDELAGDLGLDAA